MISLRVNETEIDVVRGSALDQDTDGIVNAASTAMRGGGGIDGAIHAAAGPDLLAELIAVAPNGAGTAQPVVTHGHNLKQKWIIHVAGPIWNGGVSDERELLGQAYRLSLEAASRKCMRSLSLCSLSTGVYRFPLDLAAPIAITSVLRYLHDHPESPLCRIVFALYGAQEYEVFAAAATHPEWRPEVDFL